MFTSILFPTEGVVTGQDPFEFDIKDTTGISQTTFKVTKEKFEEIKKFVTNTKDITQQVIPYPQVVKDLLIRS